MGRSGVDRLSGTIIQTVNGSLRAGQGRLHGAFEAMIVGEKLAASARNGVHLFAAGQEIAQRRDRAPDKGDRQSPGRDKADGNQEGLYCREGKL